jgi:PKD repeat protein
VTALAPGEYQCSVSASNSHGESSLDFTLNVQAPPAPQIEYVVTWAASVISGEQGQFGVGFVSEALGDADPAVWQYEWDLGAGATPRFSSAFSPQATLGAPGTYQGSVTVSNMSGSATKDFSYKVLDSN